MALAGAHAPLAQETQAPEAPATPAPATPQLAGPQAEGTGRPVIRSQIATLDRDRLFSGTAAGQAVIARFERETQALITENRSIESALEEEERQLTTRRETMPADEFRKLAAEFDTKVEELRTAQDAKSRDLTRRREEEEQAFFASTVPILGRLMIDLDVVAIIDRSALVVVFDQIDITDMAIQRLDEDFAARGGTLPAPEAAPEPTPEPTPEPAPAPTQP